MRAPKPLRPYQNSNGHDYIAEPPPGTNSGGAPAGPGSQHEEEPHARHEAPDMGEKGHPAARPEAAEPVEHLDHDPEAQHEHGGDLHEAEEEAPDDQRGHVGVREEQQVGT